MLANETRTVYVQGMEVEFIKREDRPGSGAVLDAESDDRKWRLEVTSQEKANEVRTAWDEHGNVIESETPRVDGRRAASAEAPGVTRTMTYRYTDWDGDHVTVIHEDKDSAMLAVREREAFTAEVMDVNSDNEVFGSVVVQDKDEHRGLIEALEEIEDSL